MIFHLFLKVKTKQGNDLSPFPHFLTSHFLFPHFIVPGFTTILFIRDETIIIKVTNIFVKLEAELHTIATSIV